MQHNAINYITTYNYTADIQFVIKTLKLIEIMFRLRAIRFYLFCTKIILILIT